MFSALTSRLIGNSLRRRLVLLFAVILLPPTFLSLYLAWDSFTEHKARAKLQVRQLATLAATYESKFFDDARGALQRLAEDPAIISSTRESCNASLADAAAQAPEFASLTLYSATGEPVCGSSDAVATVSHTDWFKEIRNYRQFAISDYTFGPNSTLPVIYVAQALRDSDRRLNGVLAASIELYWLSSFIRDARLPGESVFFLLDSTGNVLADRSLFLDNTNPGLPKSAPEMATAASLKSVVGQDIISEIVKRRLIDFEAIGNDNLRRVYSSVALPHGDVMVLFGMPAATALGWLERDLIAHILSLAAIWLAAIGAAWFGTRLLVTRWTASLQRMALAYGNADYTAKLDLAHAPQELSDLGNTLMLMAQRIEAREEELKANIEQKNMLLKETNHRVKNNLQIVTGLLNMRRKSAMTEEDSLAIEEIRTRVNALALVHRHLYEGDDVRLVEFRSFMAEVCHNAFYTLGNNDGRISLKLDLPDFKIAAEKAVPIALLVTEAMTNSVKYAFPGGRPGRITVSFTRSEEGGSLLSIADDGVGLPKQFREESNGTGMGLNLIRAFARQLNGTVTFSGPPGFEILVRLSNLEPGDTVRFSASEKKSAA